MGFDRIDELDFAATDASESFLKPGEKRKYLYCTVKYPGTDKLFTYRADGEKGVLPGNFAECPGLPGTKIHIGKIVKVQEYGPSHNAPPLGSVEHIAFTYDANNPNIIFFCQQVEQAMRNPDTCKLWIDDPVKFYESISNPEEPEEDRIIHKSYLVSIEGLPPKWYVEDDLVLWPFDSVLVKGQYPDTPYLGKIFKTDWFKGCKAPYTDVSWDGIIRKTLPEEQSIVTTLDLNRKPFAGCLLDKTIVPGQPGPQYIAAQAEEEKKTARQNITYRFCLVKFRFYAEKCWYRADGFDIKPGDYVTAPKSNGSSSLPGKIIFVSDYTKIAIPVPLNTPFIVKIISEAEEEHYYGDYLISDDQKPAKKTKTPIMNRFRKISFILLPLFVLIICLGGLTFHRFQTIVQYKEVLSTHLIEKGITDAEVTFEKTTHISGYTLYYWETHNK